MRDPLFVPTTVRTAPAEHFTPAKVPGEENCSSHLLYDSHRKSFVAGLYLYFRETESPVPHETMATAPCSHCDDLRSEIEALKRANNELQAKQGLDNLKLADTANESTEQKITPFSVSGAVDKHGNILPVDYDKLTRDFGASRVTPALIERFEKVTGKKAHRFMRRGMVISHREFEKILDRYEKGEKFFLYTGRGPSSDSMHIGHATPFEFTKFLQETFDCPLVIMLTDDEKFLHQHKYTIQDVEGFMKSNAKDIIGLGFDPKKTFMFSDIEFMSGGANGGFYRNILRLGERITVNSSKATFGHTDSSNVMLTAFVATQAATAFATSFPHIFGTDDLQVRKIGCLIPCAIDQDPYFRQCREHAEKLKYQKPALIHSLFLPALQGPGSKMSASDTTSAIFLSDTPKQIKTKVNKYAFSGGQDTAELQRELGGNPDVDVAYQYLNFFLDDDAELAKIRSDYRSGNLLTGELKAKCIKVIQDYVAAFQERRKEVTEETRMEFMTPKPLTYGLNPRPVVMPTSGGTEISSKSSAQQKPGATNVAEANGSNVTAPATASTPKPQNAETMPPTSQQLATSSQPSQSQQPPKSQSQTSQHSRKTSSKVDRIQEHLKEATTRGFMQPNLSTDASGPTASSDAPNGLGHARTPSKRLSRNG